MVRGNWVLMTAFMILWQADAGRAGEPAEDALRATVRITKGPRSGTGFLVGLPGAAADSRTCYLVTAAHVFNDMEGERCTVIFRSLEKDKPSARKPVDVTIRANNKPLWAAHPEMDVAVIRIELPANVDAQPLPHGQIADEKLTGEGKLRVGRDVIIPCYPAGLEANAAGWPVLRKGSIATHPLTPLAAARTMLIDYTHFGGDSGSPVLAVQDKTPMVVGIVIAMQRQTDKTVTPFEERTVHTSLGLAVTIQSPFILQTIDRLNQKPAK